MLKLKETNHSYYCSDSNYYVSGYDNFGLSEFESWEDFKQDWLDGGHKLDDDLNHLFRYDICKQEDEEGEPVDGFVLKLYFILQRKGIFMPVHVKNIEEKDMPEIESFLKQRWEYMKSQWAEVND